MEYANLFALLIVLLMLKYVRRIGKAQPVL